MSEAHVCCVSALHLECCQDHRIFTFMAFEIFGGYIFLA